MQLLDLPPSIPAGSIEDVLDERIRQVERFGHTPQADTRLPLCHLPKQARSYLEGAIDEIMFRKPGWQDRARRKLVQATALALAAIDRHDAAGGAA